MTDDEATQALLTGMIAGAICLRPDVFPDVQLETDGNGDYTGRILITNTSHIFGVWAVSAERLPDAE